MTLERDLMRVLMPMHAWVSTAEFGMTATDKLRIGVETSWRLLQKIVNDVEFMLVEGSGGIVPTPPNEVLVGKSPSKSPSMINLAAQSTSTGPFHIRTLRSTSGIFGGADSGGPGSGVATPMAPGGGKSKSSKVPPQLRALLRQAMRDGSDWHPQLHDTVAQITGMKSSKAVRTRVYVTSASTMHSLLNVLAFGREVSDEDPIDPSRIAHVTDLHYLSHFVIRCFEEPMSPTGTDSLPPGDDQVNRATRSSRLMSGSQILNPCSPKASGYRYTVEVSFSAGVMCRDEANEICPQRGDSLRENMLCVAPLEVICKNQFCSLDDFDTYLTEILAEFGKLSQDESAAQVVSD
jgi:hypothetical protein